MTPIHNVTKVTDGSLVQNLSYDNYGELTKVSDNSFTYEITSKDNSSLILQKQETINNTTKTYDYTYDDNARLVEVKKDGNVVETYSYDKNGNRTSASINGVSTAGYYTLDDQVEVYGDNTYTYDEDGYLSSKITPDGTTTYSYSTLGELKEVKTPSKTITYKHNASNQRVAKLINGVVVEKYLWADLTTLLAIYDGNDNLVQRFEYANSRMPISMTQASSKYYLHYDQVGSLRVITDSSHNIIKEIIYDSFGNILSDSNESFNVPFGFAGGLYDNDTGLTRFGYRDYDSFTGKWTAKDPIDFSGGDTNLYGYVLNDPVNLIDSNGLQGCGTQPWDLNGDGILTLDEANNWWQNGKGVPITVDVDTLNLLRTGERTAIEIDNYAVHGQVSINPENGRPFDGHYDFDIKGDYWFDDGWGGLRNTGTFWGRIYAGEGEKFEIEYR